MPSRGCTFQDWGCDLQEAIHALDPVPFLQKVSQNHKSKMKMDQAPLLLLVIHCQNVYFLSRTSCSAHPEVLILKERVIPTELGA